MEIIHITCVIVDVIMGLVVTLIGWLTVYSNYTSAIQGVSEIVSEYTFNMKSTVPDNHQRSKNLYNGYCQQLGYMKFSRDFHILIQTYTPHT